MNSSIVILCCAFYLLVLFAVAYTAEWFARRGKSFVSNPYVYALSLAVFCTAWTYYGSVGRAAEKGMDFLTTYLGPLVMAPLFWIVMRKMLRICRSQRITSIADFISSRYGKNFSIAVVVTVFSVFAIIPYISLQLKAISASYLLLTQTTAAGNLFADSSFYITIALALFTILFSTRTVDAGEKHEGMVAAIAFESIIKLIAFIAAGIFVTYQLFNGLGDIFQQGIERQDLQHLFVLEPHTSYLSWLILIFLSMLAIVFLPRQFQVTIVENTNENHLKKAIWLFPLYLLLINVFVLPIAIAGKLTFGSGVKADDYVLALPIASDNKSLALIIFIGGFAAATSMIIVATIALATMISNNLVMPVLIASARFRNVINQKINFYVLVIRRISIILVLLTAYLYNVLVAEKFSLVSLGLVSFAAVAQFAPAMLGGMYWKNANRKGALAGMIAGFTIWFYTLVLPTLVSAGYIPESVITKGLFGWNCLKPSSLFGLEGMDYLSHSVFWSLLLNTLLFVVISLYTKATAEEQYQAEIFTDIFKHSTTAESHIVWKGTAYVPDLTSLLENFLGKERTERLMGNYASRHRINLQTAKADARLVNFTERVLSGVIGSASARIMVSSVTKEEELRIDEVLHILRESQQNIELNKELRKKSTELQKATEQLTAANEQLKNMDVLKDEFLYTVTHELRTPLTSIRALSEIVHDNPDMADEQKQQYLNAVVRETERLSHLITQVLNLERYESGRQQLQYSSINMNELIASCVTSLQPLADEKEIRLQTKLPDSQQLIRCDEDLIRQVLINLISNAIKFTEPRTGEVIVGTQDTVDELEVYVKDNGKGISKELHELIFDKFFQAKNQTLKKPQGSGLGLAICKKILDMHGGKIWVESEEGKGSRFIFTLR
jgi:Na+/proline symporter/signal transduction histidine kinase